MHRHVDHLQGTKNQQNASTCLSLEGGGGGSDDSEHAVSVQGRAYVHLTGWQNTWEQAPGVPATPSPP